MQKRNNPSFLSETNAILESISDGVFTVDSNWRITSFNRAAETITGIRRREAVGKPCSEVFRASMCEASCRSKTAVPGRGNKRHACFPLRLGAA